MPERAGPALIRLLLFAVALASALHAAGPPGFRVTVQVKDTRGQEFAGPGRLLCEEWYPKINTALSGPGYPLPFKVLKLVFEPSISGGIGPSRTEIPAFSRDNTIYINSSYVAKVHKQLPDDYAGMVIHELTHITQHYGEIGDAGWLVEGIADYVRHKYFAKDIEPRLHLDRNGNLTGFESDRNKGQFATEGIWAATRSPAHFCTGWKCEKTRISCWS